MRIHNKEMLNSFFDKSDKLNVLIVSDAYYPLLGGASVVVDCIAKSMANFCNIAIVTCGGKKYIDKAPYPVIRCKAIDISANIGSLGFPKIDCEFKKIIKKMKIDIIHIHSYFSLGWYFVKLAKKLGIPAIIHGHSKFYEEYLHSSHSKLIANILTKRSIRLINKCSLVLPVSKGTLERYRNLGLKTQAQVINNATDLKYLEEKDYIKDIGLKYQINKEKIRLCYLSRITKVKNIDLIVDACKILKEKDFNFEFYFIGFGEDENYLKQKVKKYQLEDKIKFLGKVTDTKLKSALIQNTDLLVFPSVVDTCCLVKYEFASQKVPTLCTKDSATSEDILDCENGYTTKDTPEAFANKIIEIFSDKKLYEAVKEQCNLSLGKSWDAVCKQLITLYKNFLK